MALSSVNHRRAGKTRLNYPCDQPRLCLKAPAGPNPPCREAPLNKKTQLGESHAFLRCIPNAHRAYSLKLNGLGWTLSLKEFIVYIYLKTNCLKEHVPFWGTE